jgi:AcrR family transcriptional regulator
MAPARTMQRPHRREQILQAAIALFHDRGYHATGMDDIGEAAGITGPAVYRHFRSKEDILETAVRERGTATLADVHQIVAGASTPREALETLARRYTETLLADPALAVVAMYERRELDAGIRAEIDRMERRYIAEWLSALTALRPALDDVEARVLLNAALGLGLSICNYKSGLDDELLGAWVTSMIVTLLTDGEPASAGARSSPRRAARRPAQHR